MLAKHNIDALQAISHLDISAPLRRADGFAAVYALGLVGIGRSGCLTVLSADDASLIRPVMKKPNISIWCNTGHIT
ncbi:hypothetical protein [Methylomonas koyamae]|uniref:hypothetical protein n=1 Tax=Methylomonas koyamae TaxID=702114 RepID=UPI0012F6E9E6|nr:hypothetical protein [Methylomonas koyamae]